MPFTCSLLPYFYTDAQVPCLPLSSDNCLVCYKYCNGSYESVPDNKVAVWHPPPRCRIRVPPVPFLLGQQELCFSNRDCAVLILQSIISRAIGRARRKVDNKTKYPKKVVATPNTQTHHLWHDHVNNNKKGTPGSRPVLGKGAAVPSTVVPTLSWSVCCPLLDVSQTLHRTRGLV